MEVELKFQTEAKLKMKNLGTKTGTSEASLTRKVQDMEERILRTEEKVKKIDTSVKENTKLKNSRCKISRKFWTVWKTISKNNKNQ